VQAATHRPLSVHEPDDVGGESRAIQNSFPALPLHLPGPAGARRLPSWAKHSSAIAAANDPLVANSIVSARTPRRAEQSSAGLLRDSGGARPTNTLGNGEPS
jgi:hypothetical protein